MATNEKVVYAETHTTYGGKFFQPGERMTDRVPPEVAKAALESGVATTSHADAERAQRAEVDRRERVAEEIKTRSERRGGNRDSE